MRLPPAPTTLTPAAFWLWGRVALMGGFAVLFALVLYLTWLGAWQALLGLGAAVVGAGAAVFLFRRPLLNLAVVLGAFVLVADSAPGIQAAEALYGLYFFGFLGHWLVTRVVAGDASLVADAEDRAMVCLLAGITLSFGLTTVFGGSLRGAFSEWIALLMLALYFPLKDLVARERHGLRVVLGVLAWIGVFIALRNALEYYGSMRTAARLYEITNGRVVTNDGLLMVLSVVALTFLLFVEGWRRQLVGLALFGTIFAGLILTLSRGFWAGFAAGVLFLLAFMSTRHRTRLVVFGGAGVLTFLGVGVFFFGDFVLLVLGGLVERITSIGTAATQDISLMARFFESAAVWDRVQDNPVLGHGMGVSFAWYDIISRTTTVRTFNHNAFLSLWYRFGLWGLGLVLFVWLRLIGAGWRTFRTAHAPWLVRAAGLAAAAALFAYLLPANTSNPFFRNDGTFLFALLFGLAAGAHARAARTTSAATDGGG